MLLVGISLALIMLGFLIAVPGMIIFRNAGAIVVGWLITVIGSFMFLYALIKLIVELLKAS